MRPTDRDDTRDEGLTTVSLANIASEQNSLTLAQRLAILHAMSGAFWAVAALRSALSTRRDLLLESLALRHQLGVLARSDRRFRPSDRLLWVLLRRLWPRWRAALLLVQPATVARRSAPETVLRRIHGELLKLGIAVSERTVSRYLPDRLTAPSQTWRTFLANHLGDLAFISPVTPSSAPCDDEVVDARLVFRPAPLSCDAPCASNQWAVVDWPPTLRRTSLGRGVAQDHLHDRARTRSNSGRDPPTA